MRSRAAAKEDEGIGGQFSASPGEDGGRAWVVADDDVSREQRSKARGQERSELSFGCCNSHCGIILLDLISDLGETRTGGQRHSSIAAALSSCSCSTTTTCRLRVDQLAWRSTASSWRWLERQIRSPRVSSTMPCALPRPPIPSRFRLEPSSSSNGSRTKATIPCSW